MMSADTLLARLDGVKRVGAGKYVARCPAHDDRGPSLSVRELDDGRTLVHCFAGCGVDEVVGAVGLELSDLFPPRLTPPGPGKPHRERQTFSAMDALLALDFEASFVHLCAEHLAAGKPMSPSDRARLAMAAQRIADAVGVCRG